MDSSEDDFSSVMLISLSRIASRWMLLIPTQIELLTFFQGEERSLHIQATSLRCHHLMLSRGVCNFPSTIGTIHKLFGILDRTELHPTLQLEALRVLHKILLFNLSIIPCMEIPELFLKLLVVIKSSIVSTRLLTIRILADIFNKVLGRVDLVSGGTGSTLALQVISFVLDQILSLVKPVKPQVDIYQANSDVELEVKNLLNTLFLLVENHSYLHCLVLSNICLFVDRLMKMLNEVMDTEKIGLSNNETAEFGSHGKPLLSKLMLYISKIVVACLLNLEQTDNKTSQVLDSLKLQAENVCNCNFFGSYTGIRYFLLSHLLATVSYILHSAEELVFPSRNTSLSRVNSILQLDAFTLDFAKKMLGRNSYWYSYKAGKTAACQGAWSTAAFIFKQLVTVVQSASSSCWLKSLAQFSNSEEQIQLFLLRDEGISTVPSESNIGERGGLALRTIYRNYTENLLRACNTLLSAEEILAGSDMGHVFSFQRWFLTLRAKVLKTVVDMLKLLDTILFVQDGIGTGGQLEGGILLLPASSVTLDPLIYSSMEGSCRMMKLAREVDLLLTCFTGMDRQSVMSVSALALRCSLMAFTAGFAFLVPNSHPSENYRKFGDLEGLSHALLIEDLVGRLRHIDCETRKSLVTLLKSFGNCKVCFSPRFQNEISYASHEATVLHKLCKYSVGEIFSLQNEATKLQQDGNVGSQIRNSGLQLLLNIISNLMLIPFGTPHHFFHVRPSVSSELLVMNEDGQTVGGSSISSGSHLSLNLSFQLRNMKADCPSPLKKAYCIINCTIHSQITTETGDSKIDDMMDLNEKLLRYVNRSTKINGPHCRDQNSDLLTVNEYVCFEVNDRGQGFSSCLLDVSSFPVGSYRIKWHSGYVDSGGSYWSLLPANSGPLFTVCT